MNPLTKYRVFTVDDWQIIGRKSEIAEKTKNPKTLTITTRAAHLMMTHTDDRDIVTRLVVFGQKSRRIVDDERSFSRNELKTMFDLPRGHDSNNWRYAKDCKADLALPFKFIIWKNKLLIIHDKEGATEVITVSFMIKSKFKSILEKFLAVPEKIEP